MNKPKLIHIKIDGFWYWKCPICGRLLAKHTIGGVFRGRPNFQSKGAASRHLMTHNYNYVNHGRNVMEISGDGMR